MAQDAARRYRQRMQRVLAHINQHQETCPGTAELAGVAAFSAFHFQRQFTALYRLPVHRYIHLLRLKRASCALAFRHDRRVIDIALESGYEAPEAFARAFRRALGQSPSAFRAAPDWPL